MFKLPYFLLLDVQFQQVKTLLSDMNYSDIQALVNIHGAVACKETCGPSVSVTLISLVGKRNEERKTVSLTDESSEFLFSSIFPGKYRLEVRVIIPDFYRLFKFILYLMQFLVVKMNGKNHVGKLSYLLFACVGMCKYVT